MLLEASVILSPRESFLLSTSDKDSRILEIGPAHAPIAPKSQGWNTVVVDAQSAEALRDKFRGTGSNLDAIEDVDFIWDGDTFEKTIPEAMHGSFDTILASHVIEHIPDFVRFFQSASKLLKPDGSIALAVPDYRFCFDFFKSPTTTADVVSAYLQKSGRHSRRKIFEHAAYSVLHDGVGAWGQHPVSDFGFADALESAWKTVRNIDDENAGPYIDSHGWQFTPARFRLAILELGQLGLIDWQIDVLDGPNGCEFLVILRRGLVDSIGRDLLNSMRLQLLKQTIEESGIQARFLSGDPVDEFDRLGAKLDLANAVIEQLQHKSAQRDESMLQLAASLTRQCNLLEIQAKQLNQIAEVASWQRMLLSPIRSLWRKLRPGAR